MARRDEEQTAADGELVAAAIIGERDRDGTAGLGAGVEPRGVDAGARDRTAARVGHRAGQAPAAQREHKRDVSVATRDDIKGGGGGFAAVGRCCDRPLPRSEINGSGAVARRPGDDDFAVCGGAPHHRVGDRPCGVSHRDDHVCGPRSVGHDTRCC
jgi:hypothetical protein